ncbi:MAG TPA: peptidylprolyl isomerase [Cycloclasticus sp.]|jgi:peptidyl-prolyl cis-trans isomerase C|nr:peptidylprolyl isomerase [Cycloclasticus sp.]HIL92657.1 peptidylprolyl isomerase [Cycloclasticus sp.]
MKVSRSILASIVLMTITQMALANDDPTIATVNGQELKKSMLQFYALERRQVDPKGNIPADKLVDDIVNMQLLKEEAIKKKLNTASEFKARMEFINLSMLSQVAMIDFLDNNPIPEKRLRQEYDARIGDMKVTEIKASHILVKEESIAKEVIEKLNKGEKFAALAKSYSTGPTGPKGGDLGWFTPQRMVPEFSQAVLAMKDNEYTKQAVRTQFGWHIILRTGQREGTPPTFEEVKPNITAALEQEHIQKHINELRKSANISVDAKSAVN